MKYIVLLTNVILVTIAHGTGFEYFIFTQIYPISICRADNDKQPGACLIPEYISPWTIHGLWPTVNNDSIHYDFCTGAAFNLSKILSLRDRLNKNWPNLFPDASEDSLWKHEWEKHGRCFTNITKLRSEERYFNYTLLLHDKFPIYRSLRVHGIIPKSSVYYSLSEIAEALNAEYGPETTKIYCLRDKKTKQWLLADIRLCFNRDLEVIRCPKDEASLVTHSSSLPMSQPCPSAGILYPELEQSLKTFCFNATDASLYFILCWQV